MERTLAIIKPDAVEKQFAGPIIQRIESAGFRIRAMRRVHLTRAAGGGILRRPPRAAVLFRPDGVHVVRAGHRHGARGRRGDQEVARPDGRHGPRRRRRPARSVPTSAPTSSETPRTARTRPTRRRSRRAISSRASTSSDARSRGQRPWPSASSSWDSAFSSRQAGCWSGGACRLAVCPATSSSAGGRSRSTCRLRRRSSSVSR